MEIFVIGDVHGKWTEYTDLLVKYEPESSLQLGDFGLGFRQTQQELDHLFYVMKNWGDNNRFIRGNHDDPAMCRKNPFWVGDGKASIGERIFYLGGALSIDQIFRTQGVDWWEDEELSYDALFQAIEVYEAVKPRIVFTHDCPDSVAMRLFPWAQNKNEYASRTRQALDSMFAIHKPDVWMFGHWHQHIDAVVEDTRFICLNELQTAWLDVDSLQVRYNE